MSVLVEKIEQLKEEKNAAILAHYYVNDEVQAIADYVGDSYYLSKMAAGLSQKVLVFCGVKFMGESARLLSPEKTVLMPDVLADCPMAHMADAEKIKQMREKYEDLAVVCYINSTAEMKMYADVCVTSSNAMKIVSKLPNKNIFFIPDENLGSYIAKKLPEKNFILNDGYCHVHKGITKKAVTEARETHPGAKILVHPECTQEVVEMADYVGSTSGIIEYAKNSDDCEFIICTEVGVLYEMRQNNPQKQFYVPCRNQCCPDMKMITLEKIKTVLTEFSNQIELTAEVCQKANEPLRQMLELAR